MGKKKTPTAPRPQEKKEVAKKLPNGFQCPGGKLGVHIALPHPDDCRKYYICLDGVTPNEAGCPPRKVFNPTTSSCDQPSNVLGCQNYYNPLKTTRHHPLPKPVSEVVKHTVKETPRSTAGGLSVGGEFKGFLDKLEQIGLLKPGALDALKDVMLEEQTRDKKTKDKERMEVSPTGTRLSLESLSRLRNGDSRSLETKVTSSSSDVKREPDSSKESINARNSLFVRKIPPKRRNKFTGFIPKIKKVGNVENIHPVGLIKEDFLDVDKEELTNSIPSEDPALVETDQEMFKHIVAAIMSEDPVSTTTQSSKPTDTQGKPTRKRLKTRPSLFNPESRKNIFNRPRTRTRPRTRLVSSTTVASIPVEENLVEKEEEKEEEDRLSERGRPLSPSGRPNRFRRPRPRPWLRPSVRGKDKGMEEMLKVLGEGTGLKAEFEKFMKDQLGPTTGRIRIQPTGGRDRSKFRGFIPRNRLRNKHRLQQPETADKEQTHSLLPTHSTGGRLHTATSSTTSTTTTTTTAT